MTSVRGPVPANSIVNSDAEVVTSMQNYLFCVARQAQKDARIACEAKGKR